MDLDLYSSSKSGLKILEDVDPNKYIPTVFMIVDDQDYLITYNDWCGEFRFKDKFIDLVANYKPDTNVVAPDFTTTTDSFDLAK